MAYLNSCVELDDLGKGSFRSVVHLKPIAYLENGVYKLASTNVVAAADGTYSHAVLTANLGVRIGDDGKYAVHPTRELARYAAFGGPQVKVGGKWTAVPFAKPVRKNNTVIWTREQADLRLTHIGHGLKHEMWLKSGYVPEDNLIAVAVNLVGLTRSGSTLLADGVPVARIQAPVVYDAAKPLDRRPIKWDVVARDGQPYIVYSLPDLTGMAAPVIDPTLALQPDAAAGLDCYISSLQPDVNLDNALLQFGEHNGADATRRTLIKFDLSSIPASAVIVSCLLTLTVDEDNSSNARTYYAYRLKRAWVETEATWNIYSAGNNWAAAGGFHVDDCEQVAVGSVAMPADAAAGSTWDFTFTPTSVGALDLGNGWMLKGDVEVDDGYHFASSSAGAASRPKLVVDYTLPASGGMLLLGVG